MRAILVILIVCLIGKDLEFAPFPYVLRGTAQGLCLIVGAFAMLPLLSSSVFTRYWPMLLYVLVLLGTAPITDHPVFVLLEVGSLMSGVLFFLAYFESQPSLRELRMRVLVRWTMIAYGFAIVAALAALVLSPSLVYESLYAGDMLGYEHRFHGLFGKSAMMGAAAGLYIGFAALTIKGSGRKLLIMAPGLACLALTQSRTFWFAALVAGGATSWIYFRHLRTVIIGVAAILGLMATLFIAFKISVNTAGVENFTRLNTLSNLTGRTAIWQAAYDGWSRRPWFGYGYTLGGEALLGEGTPGKEIDPSELSRTTLHNGYVQSVMDSGLVGFVLYLAAMTIGIWRVIRYDTERRFPEALYAMLFLAISNVGESIIYSGSIFHSLCFWAFAIFAMGLKRLQPSRSNATQPSPSPIPVANRLPNLMQ